MNEESEQDLTFTTIPVINPVMHVELCCVTMYEVTRSKGRRFRVPNKWSRNVSARPQHVRAVISAFVLRPRTAWLQPEHTPCRFLTDHSTLPTVASLHLQLQSLASVQPKKAQQTHVQDKATATTPGLPRNSHSSAQPNGKCLRHRATSLHQHIWTTCRKKQTHQMRASMRPRRRRSSLSSCFAARRIRI
jgi:hypothetical protein